jgi:hypothetical protein
MTKKSKVTLEMGVRAAAAVRQVLFESQRGYTIDADIVPPRIFDIREVITDLDDAIDRVVEK